MSEDQSERARKLYEKLVDIRGVSNTLFWEEAKIWDIMTEEKLFQYVFGSDISSRASFASEIGIPSSTIAFKLALYRLWIKKFGFTFEDVKGLHVSKLSLLGRVINAERYDKERAKEMLNEARMVSLSDLIDQYGKE